MEEVIIKAAQLGYTQSASDANLFISEFGGYMYFINNKFIEII